MDKHSVLFITHRGLYHQQAAIDDAPTNLEVTMLRTPSKEQILSAIVGKEFLISERSGVIDSDIIKAGQNLRLIQRLGSQTHDINLEAAKAAGVPVCFLPIRSCIMVAEHMLMQMLGLSKRIREMLDVSLSGENYGHQPTRCDEDTYDYNWSGVRIYAVYGNLLSESWAWARLVLNSRAVCVVLAARSNTISGIHYPAIPSRN